MYRASASAGDIHGGNLIFCSWVGACGQFSATAGIDSTTGPHMSTLSVALIIISGLLILLALGIALFSWIAELRNPPMGAFLESNGIRLHYIEVGNPAATPIVLFHGNGSMIQDFSLSGLVDALATHYRVVCFDRPGFGHSTRPRSQLWIPETQAELFASALTQLGINNPIVLGHSWGTLVAIAMGLRAGYPVRGLILASGYYFPTWRLDFWMLSIPALPLIGDVLRYTVAPVLSLALLPGLIHMLFAPRPVSPSFRNEFPFSLTLRPKQLRAAAEESAYLVPSTARFQWRYPLLDCPVRLIHGEDDKLVEEEQAKRLDNTLPRSRLQTVYQAGHMVHYADPKGIMQAVDEMERETVGSS
jgi:pimeloyl-ACP methyl ester carboxylesterase